MRTINIGVIGWGFMGKTHTHALREMPLFYEEADFRPHLRAVAAAHAQKARAACRNAGFDLSYDDWRDLVADPSIEAVSISTPNSLHEEMILSALAAGKHVYVDKPAAMDAPSAQRIRAAAARSGRLLMVANNNRFFPATMRARELVEAGRIGEVLSFRFDYLHSGSVDPERPVGWKQLEEGGVLLDLGTHVADLLMWLCGPVESVQCATRVLYPTRPTAGGETVRIVAEDQACSLIRLQNGALGTMEVSKIATGTEDELRFEIHGSAGALRFDLMSPGYLDFYDQTRPETPLGGERGYNRIAATARYPAPGGKFLPVKNAIGWDRSHMHAYFTFLNCIAHGLRPSPDAEEACRLAGVIDAMKESARTGRWVRPATL